MASKNITIVDYGMGNLGSVQMAFEKLGLNIKISNNLDDLSNSDAYILPGVGAFPQGVLNLKRSGIFDLLNEQILLNKKPILGICLGMQLMANFSLEQGKNNGFGWIDGEVIPIKATQELHVPHVGWNNLHMTKQDSLFHNIDNEAHFFYDQSYQFKVNDQKCIIGVCDYGDKIVSVVRKNHILGSQFHPEKSQRNGLKLLRNFLIYTDEYYKTN
jgi:imidazole glycerol-phosphate synthase subunit HisH